MALVIFHQPLLQPAGILIELPGTRNAAVVKSETATDLLYKGGMLAKDGNGVYFLERGFSGGGGIFPSSNWRMVMNEISILK